MTRVSFASRLSPPINSNDEPEKPTRHKTTIKSCHRGGDKNSPEPDHHLAGLIALLEPHECKQSKRHTNKKNGLKLLAPETSLTEHDEIKTKSTRNTTQQRSRATEGTQWELTQHIYIDGSTAPPIHVKRENDKLRSNFFSRRWSFFPCFATQIHHL